MDHAEAILGIAVGAGAVVMGLRSKEFYALGPGQRPKPTTRRLPLWLGRLWCIGFGGFMFYWSLPDLSGKWRWNDLSADWWLAAFLGAAWIANSVVHRMRISEPKSGIPTLDLKGSKETPRIQATADPHSTRVQG